jgi:hypothetical protein
MSRQRLIQGVLVAACLCLAPALLAAEARVQSVTGRHIVVQGSAVHQFVPHLPVWIVEDDHGKPGLLLAEGEVTSVVGDRATVDLAERDPGSVHTGDLVEPRWKAEARLYRGALPTSSEPGHKDASADKPSEPQVRVRHRRPETVLWGKSLWLEALLEGPADKLAVMYRLGESGPYTELAMASKGDSLFGVQVPIVTKVASEGEPEPSVRVLEYYLVAFGGTTAARVGVAGNPAEPLRVTIESAPEPPTEELVQHGPVDRGSQHKPLEITGEVNKRFVKPTVMYRARGSGAYLRLPMHQQGAETWVAEIPARDVVAPGLAYYITVVDEKGVVRDGFASSRSPQNVTVLQPQILSNEENRNQLTLGWQHVDFGAVDDRYDEFEVGIERLFFGFLIARINGGYLTGRAVHGIATTTTDPAGKETTAVVQTPELIRMKRGRAGLDLHLGDYVSVSGDVSMAIYTGAGLGYRLALRLGDEQVATIDGMVEKIWDLKTGNKFVDVYRGSLAVPVAESWRVQGTAVFESVLQTSSDDKALRLLLGVERDLGEHLILGVHGGLAGRQQANGPDVGVAVRMKF